MKINTQHTPGPWNLSGGFNNGYGTIPHKIITQRGVRIADIAQHLLEVGDAPTAAANARLIAAAPELLEALLALDDAAMSAMGMEPGSEPPLSRVGRAIKDARAAIAKAKGEEEVDKCISHAAAWRDKASRNEHPGRGFCLTQAERWEARAAIAKAKGGEP